MFNSNNDPQGLHATMDPRISFSNDFADSQQHPAMEHDQSYREAPVSSSDFEFSVSGYNMISADELFFKGKLLPLREEKSTRNKTTLRDKLLAQDDGDGDDNDDFSDDSPRQTKRMSMSRWKERLGLKRSPDTHHHLPRNKAAEKINNLEAVVLQRIDEGSTTLSFDEEAYFAANFKR